MSNTSSDAEPTAEDLDFVRIDSQLIEAAVRALRSAKDRGLQVVAAESCTGGLIATVLSEAPGAAEHLAGSFVVYTPEQKCAALNLDPRLIERFGTVSKEVATAMAEAAIACSKADLAVAVTGVAGPDPDERGNPVGLVYIAGAIRERSPTCVERNFGDIGRSRIRYASAMEALALLSMLAHDAD